MTKEIHDINTRALDFVVELIDYIFEYPDDDYMTMECLCRKLAKHGLLDKADGYYQTHEIRTNTHECVKDTHDKTELTEPHIYGLFRKGELSDDDVKELKKQIGQIIEYADRKTEPQNCDDCIWSVCNYNKAFEDEPQTCSVNGRPYDCGNCEYHKCTADEPQTERSE